VGFRPNRSTVDNIFIVRQIFDKSQEHNIELYNTFVAYTHSFDSVLRNKLIEFLKKFDVPDELMRLIALNKRARVKINRDFTEEFIVKCGVKQGDPLAATLFSFTVSLLLEPFR